MGIKQINLISYSIELIKIFLITVGIMGFRLRFKWYSVCISISCVTVIIVISYNETLSSVSLITGLLSVITTVFIISGRQKIICSALAYLSISILDMVFAALIMFVLEIETNDLYAEPIYPVIINTLSIVILVIIAGLRAGLKNAGFYHISHMKISYTVAVVISLICFLLYLTPAVIFGFDGRTKLLASLGLSFSGLFFTASNIAFVESAYSKRLFKSLYKNTRDQSENLSEYFSRRIKREKERQKIYHDMPYHLLSIQSLIRYQDTAKLDEYINELTERFLKSGQSVNTGNHQLNAIISGCTGKYPNSKTEITGIMPNDTSISNHDFCVILSNLLDNAFKSADTLSGIVNIVINPGDNVIHIRILNPVKKKVKISDNLVQSIHSGGRGIGMVNILEYVKNVKGRIFFRCNDKYFVADLYLPL